MPVAETLTMYLDQSRCIGCQSCVQACSECDTHKGKSMIHLETADRAHSVQTMPVVCMHCESPTCAEDCPADAIKKTVEGIDMSARKQACIACIYCVLACPFGVPKMMVEFELMMNCDLCYDRTSVG
jgi:Fe-S-cluster-containing dehydrogenase component